jgi:hypothetical protein
VRRVAIQPSRQRPPRRGGEALAVASKIVLLRGERVLLDADLAVLCGAPTEALVRGAERVMPLPYSMSLASPTGSCHWTPLLQEGSSVAPN